MTPKRHLYAWFLLIATHLRGDAIAKGAQILRAYVHASVWLLLQNYLVVTSDNIYFNVRAHPSPTRRPRFNVRDAFPTTFRNTVYRDCVWNGCCSTA